MKRSAVPWLVVAGALLSFSYASQAPEVATLPNGTVRPCESVEYDSDGTRFSLSQILARRAMYCTTDKDAMALRFAMGMGGTLAIAGAFWISLGAGKPEE